jgi:hypothetical protein
MFGVFEAQILPENFLVTFGREPHEIEIFGVGFDPHRWNVRERLEQLLIGDHESRRDPASRGDDEHALGAPGIGGGVNAAC